MKLNIGFFSKKLQQVFQLTTPLMSLQHGWNICILHRVYIPKVGFYIVNVFLLLLYKSQKDPSLCLYNLAHSDVIVFDSF